MGGAFAVSAISKARGNKVLPLSHFLVAWVEAVSVASAHMLVLRVPVRDKTLDLTKQSGILQVHSAQKFIPAFIVLSLIHI